MLADPSGEKGWYIITRRAPNETEKAHGREDEKLTGGCTEEPCAKKKGACRRRRAAGAIRKR